MTLVRQSLCSCPCRILRSCSAFKHGNTGVWSLIGSTNLPLVNTQIELSRKQLVRALRALSAVVTEGSGYGRHSMPYNPYFQLELDMSDTVRQTLIIKKSGESQVGQLQYYVTLNEAAPPVVNVFGSSGPRTGFGEMKGGNITEAGAAFLRNKVERKVEAVKQALESIEESAAPTPYAPTQGDDAAVFVVVSIFLIFLFWIGNWVAPNWIFKETVFRNSEENKDDNLDEDRERRPTTNDIGPRMWKEYDQGSQPDTDPADLIELPKNLMPFREAAVAGFKAGRQSARESEEKRKKKRSRKGQ